MVTRITYRKEDLPEGATVRSDPVGGHREGADLYFVAPGRRVIDIPGQTWPAARPEECGNGGNVRTRWFGEKVLLCLGCGVDCT